MFEGLKKLWRECKDAARITYYNAKMDLSFGQRVHTTMEASEFDPEKWLSYNYFENQNVEGKRKINTERKIMIAYIKDLIAMGKGVIKEDKITLNNDRIYSDECGFYVIFDLVVVLTPETRINLLMPGLEININKCEISDPASKTHKIVELVKLVGSGYALYNIYHIKKYQHLRFFLDTKVKLELSKLELRLENFYYTGDNASIPNGATS
jgi:hypothetical protein